MRFITSLIFPVLILIASAGPAWSQSPGSIKGQVIDSLSAVVVGATITVVSSDGKQKQAISNARGEFSVAALMPGIYSVKAIAPNFGLYENTEVTVNSGESNEITILLTVAGIVENVEVGNDNQVSNDPDNNAGATVIKGIDLDALPDDPDELQAALQALAGASAGPNGGQIYIDGFTGGQLPPKESIREIRINQNPFSAEFDRLGFGRIEILTKPGTDKWRGQLTGNFNDESLNSRNPFATNRAPSQMRAFGANISGPVQKKRSSFFLDFNNRDNDSNAIVNAQILDPSFNIINFRQDLTVPTKRFSIGPRFDYAINDRNTFVARYRFSHSSSKNQGIGDTSLPSRAYKTTSTEHEIRLTETMIINAKTVNETRFEYSHDQRDQSGDNSIPTINVASAFVGGGSQIGLSFNRNRSWELSNFTTTSFGKNSQHAVKFGLRLRDVSLSDRSESNFGGTFIFPGFVGADPFDLDGDGVVSPIEQYRAKVLGAIGTRYDPSRFDINAGNPLASVSRFDAGLFVTDDWRVSPALLLSFGLRYENQTNIKSNFNFAPRVGFAWSPGAGGAKAPKTVFRGGGGIFYDRFGENLTLQALRFNGLNQLNLLVNANETDPVRKAAALALLAQPIFTLSGVANVPTSAQILAALPQSNTIRQVSPDIQSPYTIQGAIGVERQLPFKTTLAAFFITTRTLHQLRARNINAPVCPLQTGCASAPRPQDLLGDLYEYESSGSLKQNQLIVNFRNNYSSKFSLFGNYRLGFANGDTDGAGSFPSYSYDLAGEYGRSSFDVRHNFIIGGNINVPGNISLSPFIIASSGRPFNITRGIDPNGDGLFTERPTYGDLRDRCTELRMTASYCDIGSNDPSAIIPRNLGEGPSYFSVNLRVGRNLGFGRSAPRQAASGGDSGGSRRPAGMIGERGGGGGGRGDRGSRGSGGGGSERKPYNLNFGVSFSNLFNNVNFGTPVGNLVSSRFGQSTATSGGFGGFGGGGGGGSTTNRRVELQLRFSF